MDIFGLIPPPKGEDGAGAISRYELIKAGKSAGIRGGKYYGYVDNLKDVVIANFKSFNLAVDRQRIRLVEGLYEDTLSALPEMQVAFAHLDCDLYDSVHLCLAYVAPRLAPGGFIIWMTITIGPDVRKPRMSFSPCTQN